MTGRENISEPSVVYRMEDSGFVLLPKFHPDSPGYTGLIVAIRDAPTKRHYDPESIHLRISDKDDLASWVTLNQNSRVATAGRVCPGSVVLSDRKDKRIYFFTFGGHLESITIPGERLYTLYSSAPILETTNNPESFPNQLVAEVESLLAELQAKWGKNDRDFARQLARIDPLQFYVASLQAILGRYQQNRRLREGWPGFYTRLRKEKDWLVQAGQWPTVMPSLEDLLLPHQSAKHR